MGCVSSAHDAGDAGEEVIVTAIPASSQPSEKQTDRRPSASTCFSNKGYVVEHTGRLEDFYVVGATLGEGSYGTVALAKNRASGTEHAVKSLAKTRIKDIERFKREIKLMTNLDHPNIVRVSDSFEAHSQLYLVMELCTGGELLDRVLEMGQLGERQAAVTMQQIFRAVNYLHETGICHRDLKPQNFLFATKDPIETCTLKLIDFGLARMTDGQTFLKTKAGTPYYIAPEVLTGNYLPSADLWSCGVIMYLLLSGYPPFRAKHIQGVLDKVRKGSFDFNGKEFEKVSEDAKDLITCLLRKDPSTRFTAKEALSHVWVEETAPAASSASLSRSLVENLRSFRADLRLKKAALHVIASQLSEPDIRSLREAFIVLDTNSDGQLTPEELRAGIESAGFREVAADVSGIMDEVDFNGSGSIDYTEFIAATIDKKHYIDDQAAAAAFGRFDLNGDGKLNKDEIILAIQDADMTMTDTKQCVEDILNHIDEDGDGAVDYNEFLRMLRI